YTGDVRNLAEIFEEGDESLFLLLDSVKNYKSNGTSNLFCETDDNDISWLYIPEPEYKAHRIIYTGNFSPTNNRGSNRKTCVVEFSGKCAFETMSEEVKKLPGNLVPISFNYEPNSYVIQDKDTKVKINQIKSHLKNKRIFTLGRFAEWEYYNMDMCIEKALAVSEDIRALAFNN
ncbi:MAG: UDP-galactopyranose mutase, partial [Bacteroidota bacterium]|nr:UDP-galactopyranose mutase [Bacteroidota bacterium]